MKLKNIQWALVLIILILLILGVTLALQLRVARNMQSEGIRRTEELSSQVATTKKECDALQAEVSRISAQLDRLSAGPLVPQAKESMGSAEILAGVTELTGNGVEVTLKDSSISLEPGDNPNLYVVHDEDILKVVNELKAAGAEAISVNGQRLIATTEINCSGPTIRVNKKPLTPPFVITAIGNPETMESSLKMKGGVAEILQFYGVQVLIKKLSQITIPAYTELFAAPDNTGIRQNEANDVLEIAKIKQYAGIVPLSGPGVEISVESFSGQAVSGSVYDCKSITDEDLLKIVNDLRNAGAEAIAINDQRLLATSEIRLAGNHINVNAIPLSPPYLIAAIGNASALKSRLEIKEGLVEYLKKSGVSVKVKVKDKLTIPSFTGTVKFEYAKPVQ